MTVKSDAAAQRITDLTNAPKIVQIQAAAALENVRNEMARHSKIRDLIVGNSRGVHLGEVVTLHRTEPNPTEVDAAQDDISADIYVAELANYDGESLYAAVVNGNRPQMYFLNKTQAILDAIARQHGSGDDRATASMYAARVLGVNLGD